MGDLLRRVSPISDRQDSCVVPVLLPSIRVGAAGGWQGARAPAGARPGALSRWPSETPTPPTTGKEDDSLLWFLCIFIVESVFTI